jgi:hypothetical protein
MRPTLATGCGKEMVEAATPKPEDAPGMVRLIDPGSEPRAPVRWRPPVGKSRRLLFTTRTGTQSTRERIEVRLPTMTPASEFRYEATLQMVELVEAPGSEEERRLKNAQGTMIAATVTRLGELRESELQGDESARTLRAWARWGVVPFPQANVGAGAIWETEGDHGHTRWELVASDGIRAVVRFKDEISGGDLAAAGPTAEGEVVVDLTRAPADKIAVTIRPPPGVARPATTIAAASAP